MLCHQVERQLVEAFPNQTLGDYLERHKVEPELEEKRPEWIGAGDESAPGTWIELPKRDT